MYAQPMRVAVQTRRMPPWGADNTGLCGTWEGARWLSTEEITTVAKWQESGSLEGEAATSREPTAKAPPFRVDATLETGGVYRPGLGAGGNRCFLADPKLDRDRLLTAIRVVSSDPRAVAQVTLFALDSETAAAEVGALDAREAGLGYSCFGSARVSDARLVASWTWPDPTQRMPVGTGVPLHAGRKVVVQIHYNIAQTGGTFEAATHVDLEFEDGVQQVRVVPISASGSLEPGRRYVSIENRQSIDRRMRVVGMAPRMHIRGETMQITIERGAKSICLANFDHWNIYNQQLFSSQRPVGLEPNDRVRISCVYGTLGREQPVVFGDGIDDEECVAYLFVTD